MKKSKVIAIVNRKGGVGKTATTSSLGFALARLGNKVLLIDADSQCSLSACHGVNEDKTLFNAMVEQSSIPVVTIADNVSLCPASPDLIGIDKALRYYINDDVKELQVMSRLVSKVRGEYDYILIDCSPDMGIVTRNSLICADGVIIPMTAEALPAQGVNSLLDDISLVRSSMNPGLQVDGIVITRYNRRRINNIIEGMLREAFGDMVFKTRIRENVDLAECPINHEDIFTYNEDSNGAKDYMALARELVTK